MSVTSNPDAPLFFSDPVVITSGEHGDLKFKPEEDYGFASHTNSIPVTISEFERAAAFYPIVFTQSENKTAIVITGLKQSENLFIENDNSWRKNTYIPAYVRKYPFLFMESLDHQQFTLCVERKNMIDGKDGETLFENGEPAKTLKEALEFCKNFHASWQQTFSFIEILNELELLVERRADIQTQSGENMSLSGFNVIDREKFSALPKKALNEIPPQFTAGIYAHFLSMSCWDRLMAAQSEKE